MDALADHLLVGILRLVHDDDVIRSALDLGAGVGSLAATEGARLQLDHLALGLRPLVNLRVEQELDRAVRGEPVHDAAEEQFALVINRSEEADPQPLLEALEHVEGRRQLGEEHHAPGKGVSQRLGLAALASPQGGQFLGVTEDDRLDDPVGERLLIGVQREARQLLAEDDDPLHHLVQEVGLVGVQRRLFGLLVSR